MAQWPEARPAQLVEQALEMLQAERSQSRDISPADVAAVLEAQRSLLPAEAADLHPCTDCTKLNVGGFCAHYQKVLPEPAVPNARVHFEARLPDVPWA